MINEARDLVAEDMAGFEAINGEAVKNYLMEEGGQPVRAMVTTTWRSGSTFLGDIMTAHPGTFYHYEPLLHYDIVQARSGALAEDAVRTLKSLMTCNYTSLGDIIVRLSRETMELLCVERYLEYGKTHHWLFLHNERLWTHCLADGPRYQKSYCWDPAFLNRFVSTSENRILYLKLPSQVLSPVSLPVYQDCSITTESNPGVGGGAQCSSSAAGERPPGDDGEQETPGLVPG